MPINELLDQIAPNIFFFLHHFPSSRVAAAVCLLCSHGCRRFPSRARLAAARLPPPPACSSSTRVTVAATATFVRSPSTHTATVPFHARHHWHTHRRRAHPAHSSPPHPSRARPTRSSSACSLCATAMIVQQEHCCRCRWHVRPSHAHPAAVHSAWRTRHHYRGRLDTNSS